MTDVFVVLLAARDDPDGSAAESVVLRSVVGLLIHAHYRVLRIIRLAHIQHPSMSATKAASACGGMHQCSFSHGFASFFERLPNCLVTDRLDDVQSHQLIGQQPQTPPRASFRRCRTGQL
ncbi:MAG: hypothetical protein R3C02_09070 [Planctomycetaceae bacterium]